MTQTLGVEGIFGGIVKNVFSVGCADMAKFCDAKRSVDFRARVLAGETAAVEWRAAGRILSGATDWAVWLRTARKRNAGCICTVVD